MTICKTCGTSFPNYVTVDGIKRNISARKHCLGCSPFGQHNTRTVLAPTTKFCRLCEKDLSTSEFYPRGKGVTPYCKGCTNQSSGKLRRALKQKAVDYKGGCCELCSYSRCLSALEFHHRDPTQKDFTISNTKLSWELMVLELDKCQLLCANCHREVHGCLIR